MSNHRGLLRLLSLLALLLLCLPSPCTAAEPAIASSVPVLTLAHLHEVNRRFTTMRVPFTQVKHLAILDDPVECKGVLEISRPLSAVRWEFTGRSVLLFNNGKLRRCDAAGNLERSSAADPSLRALAGQMRALLDGDWRPMRQLFTIVADPHGAPTFTFTPLSPDLKGYMSLLQIRFRSDLSAPESLLIVANGDDRIDYTFAPPQLDIDIPAKRFQDP